MCVSETYGMREKEQRNLNVIKIKRLHNMYRMERLSNIEVRRRVGLGEKLSGRVD